MSVSYAVDYMVADTPRGRRTAAIEINLRRGGTTHPMMTMEILTNGTYDAATGQFVTQAVINLVVMALFIVLRPSDSSDIGPAVSTSSS